MASYAEAKSSAELVAEVIDRGSVSVQQIVVVVLCLLLNMLDGFDITAMAVTAHPIGQELGLSEDRLGFVFSFRPRWNDDRRNGAGRRVGSDWSQKNHLAQHSIDW